VGMTADLAKDGQALRGDGQLVVSEGGLGVAHGFE
jgi:hypothetical protein